MSKTHFCEQCGCTIVYVDQTSPPKSFCSASCTEAWEAASPGTWIAVEDMTFVQRAELAAMLGLGAKA